METLIFFQSQCGKIDYRSNGQILPYGIVPLFSFDIINNVLFCNSDNACIFEVASILKNEYGVNKKDIKLCGFVTEQIKHDWK